MSFQKQKTILIAIILSLGALFALPLVSSAAGLVPCGGPSENNKPCTVTDAFTLVARATNWLIAMAGVFAVYKIVDHSFWLVISMGNEESITAHKAGLSNAVVGFVLVMIAFMLVNTVVNVLLTRDLSLNSNQQCKLDLTNPLNYLSINDPTNTKYVQCTNLPEQFLHQ